MRDRVVAGVGLGDDGILLGNGLLGHQTSVANKSAFELVHVLSCQHCSHVEPRRNPDVLDVPHQAERHLHGSATMVSRKNIMMEYCSRLMRW